MALAPLQVHASTWKWRTYFQKARNTTLSPDGLGDHMLQVLAPTQNWLTYDTEKILKRIDEKNFAIHLADNRYNGALTLTQEDLAAIINGIFEPVNERALRMGLTASDVVEILYHFDLDDVAKERPSVKSAFQIYREMQEVDGISSDPLHGYQEDCMQLLSALITYHDIREAAKKNTEQRNPSFEGARAYMITVIVGLLNKLVSRATVYGSPTEIARNIRQFNSTRLRADTFHQGYRESLENVWLAFLKATNQVGSQEALEMLDRELSLGADDLVRAVEHSAGKVTSTVLQAIALSAVAFLVVTTGLSIGGGTPILNYIVGGLSAASIGTAIGYRSKSNRIKLSKQILNHTHTLRRRVLKRVFGIDKLPCELALVRNHEELLQ